MNRKVENAATVSKLFLLLILGLMFSSCGTNYYLYRFDVKNATDIEREQQVQQYKPKFKSEPKLVIQQESKSETDLKEDKTPQQEPAQIETETSDNNGRLSSLEERDCWTCRGSGKCKECGGDGKVDVWGGDRDYKDTTRRSCGGDGRCRDCNGRGRISVNISRDIYGWGMPNP